MYAAYFGLREPPFAITPDPSYVYPSRHHQEALAHLKMAAALGSRDPQVIAAIEALSEDLRQAVTLREIEGLSYEEIAEVMNCPIGTVRSRIFRAREAIALRLRPLLDTSQGRRW